MGTLAESAARTPGPTTTGAPRPAAQAVLLAGSCFTLLAGASIAPALPGIYAEFAATPNAALLSRGVLAIAPLFMAIGAALAGPLIDRFGRRRMLIGAVFATGITGTAGYVAPDLWTLLLTRVLLGLSVGGVTTACITLIGDYFVDDARRRFLGYQAAAMKLGGVVFLLLGGWLAGFGWRYPFLVDLLALLIVPAAMLAIAEPARRPTAAVRAATRELRRPVVLMVFAVAFVAQVLFFAVPTQLPFFMTDVLREPPQRVGAVIAISAVTSALVATQYPRIARRFPYRTIFVGVFGLMGAGFAVLAGATTTAAVVASMLLIGVGVGVLVPNLTWVLLEAVAPELRGRAAGGMTTAQMLGQFASPLVAALPAARWGLPTTFAAIAGASLFVAALFLIAQRRTRAAAPVT